MEENVTPTKKLRTNRAMWKYFLFTILTLGIYDIVIKSHISTEINDIASKYDNRHTMHYCLIFFIFSWLTCGICPLVWNTRICSRMGKELARRNIDYKISGGTFWGWNIFGTIIIVGPFIFYHKFFKAMNLLCEDYNTRG